MKKRTILGGACAVVIVGGMLLGGCASESATSRSSTAQQNDYPEWYLNPGEVYPDAQYLTAVGTGSTRRAAEQEAMAGLAQIFRSEIEVDSTTQERYREIMTSQGKVEESEIELAQTLNVRAAQTLLNVQTGEAAVDDRGRTHVIAYIERIPTGQLYADLINENSSQIVTFIDEAEATGDILRRFAYLNAATVVAHSSEVLASQLRIISPITHQGIQYPYSHNDLLRERADTAEQMLVAVSIDGDTGDRIGGILRQTLGDERFPISADNPVLSVNGRISIDPVNLNPDFETVRWVLNIDVQRTGAATLVSFDDQGRASGPTVEQARAFAYQDIQQAIERKFRSRLQRYFDSLVLGDE